MKQIGNDTEKSAKAKKRKRDLILVLGIAGLALVLLAVGLRKNIGGYYPVISPPPLETVTPVSAEDPQSLPLEGKVSAEPTDEVSLPEESASPAAQDDSQSLPLEGKVSAEPTDEVSLPEESASPVAPSVPDNIAPDNTDPSAPASPAPASTDARVRAMVDAFFAENAADSYLLMTTATGTYIPIPLNEDGAFRLTQPDGSENVVHIGKDSFYMESSNCENQNCIYQGEVTLENRDERMLLNMIICLPHELRLELLSADEAREVLTQMAAQQIGMFGDALPEG